MYKSYGTISRQEKNWHIECEPHVKTRLKRVFPKVSQHASKFLKQYSCKLSFTGDKSRRTLNKCN